MNIYNRYCTLASKKSLAPITPSVDTLISDSLASAIRPLSSCSSPAAALRKISRNYRKERKRIRMAASETGVRIQIANLIRYEKEFPSLAVRSSSTLYFELSAYF